jgi:hypothetical protein
MAWRWRRFASVQGSRRRTQPTAIGIDIDPVDGDDRRPDPIDSEPKGAAQRKIVWQPSCSVMLPVEAARN